MEKLSQRDAHIADIHLGGQSASQPSKPMGTLGTEEVIVIEISRYLTEQPTSNIH